MPTIITKEPYFMNVVMDDPLDLDSMTAIWLEFFHHPDFETGIHVLWDARKVTQVDLSFEDVKAFGDFLATHRERRGGGRSAFVALQDILFGIFRTHEMLNDASFGYEFRVFREIESAREWLTVVQ